ncbi:MAG: TetR/AcrR family transcriptional regulator [Prolixibacteraceae bacterium]|nr:TetR/AcrR family transcriptional regulator [Prolixibacteraceae bacterium]
MMENVAGKGKRLKKDLRKEQILKVAHEIFTRYGYKKTTLDDISKAVRKGKSSLYYYFDSKEDLFYDVVLKEADVLKRELESVVLRNIDPVEKLRDYIMTKLTISRDLVEFYHSSDQDSIQVDFIEKIKQKHIKDEIRMIKRILIEGIRKNVFEVRDLTLVAIGITTAIKGLETPLSEDYGNVSLEKSVDNILKILCYGLMKRP